MVLNFGPVQDLTIAFPGTGPGFKSWAELKACLLASSRWEPALLSRPSPSEARLGCKYTRLFKLTASMCSLLF